MQAEAMVTLLLRVISKFQVEVICKLLLVVPKFRDILLLKDLN